MSIHNPQVVHMNGPFRGGMGDLEIFRDEFKAKIQGTGKKVIADQGYSTPYQDEMAILSLPNTQDSKELANFKARARCRHETFNSRIKCFNCLSETFRHGFHCHKLAFEAVVVLVQIQMNCGSPIFAV